MTGVGQNVQNLQLVILQEARISDNYSMLDYLRDKTTLIRVFL
jgi:hypothetical protein